MNRIKFVYTIYIFLFLFSCTDKNDKDELNSFPVNEEKVVVLNGSASKVIYENRYSPFYPTQIFEKEYFEKENAFKEVKNAGIPYHLIFHFTPAPYVEEVTTPAGYLSFTKARSNAMNSEEWEMYNNRTTATQFLSYGSYSSIDEAKKFLKDASFYNLLDKGDKEYIFLAKIILAQFDVTADIDLKDKANMLYVSSVSFGRYAYIAIPTDNPANVIDLFTNGILKKNPEYIDEYIKICTSVNIVEKGGKSSSHGYLGKDGFNNLVDVFDINSEYMGIPIYFQVKDPVTNELIN